MFLNSDIRKVMVAPASFNGKINATKEGQGGGKFLCNNKESNFKALVEDMLQNLKRAEVFIKIKL